MILEVTSNLGIFILVKKNSATISVDIIKKIMKKIDILIPSNNVINVIKNLIIIIIV